MQHTAKGVDSKGNTGGGSLPTIGMAPLQMTQLMATWAGVLPSCPDPISFIRPIKGCSFSSLSSLKMAVRGPLGLSPPAVYLPEEEEEEEEIYK